MQEEAAVRNQLQLQEFVVFHEILDYAQSMNYDFVYLA